VRKGHARCRRGARRRMRAFQGDTPAEAAPARHRLAVERPPRPPTRPGGVRPPRVARRTARRAPRRPRGPTRSGQALRSSVRPSSSVSLRRPPSRSRYAVPRLPCAGQHEPYHGLTLRVVPRPGSLRPTRTSRGSPVLCGGGLPAVDCVGSPCSPGPPGPGEPNQRCERCSARSAARQHARGRRGPPPPYPLWPRCWRPRSAGGALPRRGQPVAPAGSGGPGPGSVTVAPCPWNCRWLVRPPASA
jgi:hypothetical protein